jgi:hypothetical protein
VVPVNDAGNLVLISHTCTTRTGIGLGPRRLSIALCPFVRGLNCLDGERLVVLVFRPLFYGYNVKVNLAKCSLIAVRIRLVAKSHDFCVSLGKTRFSQGIEKALAYPLPQEILAFFVFPLTSDPSELRFNLLDLAGRHRVFVAEHGAPETKALYVVEK